MGGLKQTTNNIATWPIRSITGQSLIPSWSSDVIKLTWIWRWLPHRLSKRQSLSRTVLFTTTIELRVNPGSKPGYLRSIFQLKDEHCSDGHPSTVIWPRCLMTPCIINRLTCSSCAGFFRATGKISKWHARTRGKRRGSIQSRPQSSSAYDGQGGRGAYARTPK